MNNYVSPAAEEVKFLLGDVIMESEEVVTTTTASEEEFNPGEFGEGNTGGGISGQPS